MAIIMPYHLSPVAPYSGYKSVKAKTQWTLVHAVLVAFQCSVALLIVRHGRKEKSFRQAFFVLFVAVTVVDCLLMIQDRLDAYIDELNKPLIKLTFEVVLYAGSNFQPLVHTAIAANRLTAFFFPLEYDSIWTPRVVRVLLAVISGIAIALGIGGHFILALTQCYCVPDRVYGVDPKIFGKLVADEGLFGLDFIIDKWVLAHGIRALNYALCSVVSFALSLVTVVKLRSINSERGQLRHATKGPDVRLFVHSLWMFLLQLLIGFQYSAMAIDSLDNYIEEIREYSGDPNIDWKWIHQFNSGVWLGGCEDRPLYEHTCRYSFAWRLLLVYIDLDFLILAFAASGGAFLLIVSGQVRRAYFRFYLRCLPSLKRKRAIVVAPASTTLYGQSTTMRAVT